MPARYSPTAAIFWRGGLLLLGVLMLHPSAFAVEGFPGVEKLMDEAEFEQAGLNKLSADELKRLNGWLVRYTAEDAETLSESVPEIKKLRAQPIISAIEGDFTGWSGNTIFRLANGQVWQQRNDGYFRYRDAAPAVAVIEKSNFGFYSLKVEGHQRRVGVKRLK